jgi:hypothetical protein
LQPAERRDALIEVTLFQTNATRALLERQLLLKALMRPGRSTRPARRTPARFPWARRLARKFRKRVLFWFAEAAILFVFWLIYVHETAAHELMVGAGAAVLAATGAEAVRGLNFARFYPHAKWLLLFWRVPGSIVNDCWVLSRALAERMFLGRALDGETAVVRFDPGGADPRSAARRAIAVTFSSLSPNFIAIRIERKRRLLLYHQVRAVGVPVMLEKLGAEP